MLAVRVCTNIVYPLTDHSVRVGQSVKLDSGNL